MIGNGDEKPRFVTLTELDRKMEKLPTRWEVRFLILAAFIGGQVLPSVQVNQPIKSGMAAIVQVFV